MFQIIIAAIIIYIATASDLMVLLLMFFAKTVAIVTITSCGADNIGLFTPYFVTLNANELLVTLFVFIVLIFVLVWTAQQIATIPGISRVMEKFSRWIVAIVYIGLGSFIIYQNDTIPTLLSLLN